MYRLLSLLLTIHNHDVSARRTLRFLRVCNSDPRKVSWIDQLLPLSVSVFFCLLRRVVNVGSSSYGLVTALLKQLFLLVPSKHCGFLVLTPFRRAQLFRFLSLKYRFPSTVTTTINFLLSARLSASRKKQKCRVAAADFGNPTT